MIQFYWKQFTLTDLRDPRLQLFWLSHYHSKGLGFFFFGLTTVPTVATACCPWEDVLCHSLKWLFFCFYFFRFWKRRRLHDVRGTSNLWTALDLIIYAAENILGVQFYDLFNLTSWFRELCKYPYFRKYYPTLGVNCWQKMGHIETSPSLGCWMALSPLNRQPSKPSNWNSCQNPTIWCIHRTIQIYNICIWENYAKQLICFKIRETLHILLCFVWFLNSIGWFCKNTYISLDYELCYKVASKMERLDK